MVRAAAAVARAVVGRRRSTSISAAREGLRRRTPAPLEGRVLFLDTRPLHALLMQNVVVLEQKIKSAAAVRTERRSAASSSACSTKLAVAGRSRIQAVRAPRRAHGRGGHRRRDRRLRQDLGLPARGGARSRLRCSSAGKSFGGTMELAVFGRMRNEARPPRRARAAAPRAVRGARRAVGSQGRQRRPASGCSRR